MVGILGLFSGTTFGVRYGTTQRLRQASEEINSSEEQVARMSELVAKVVPWFHVPILGA